MNRKLDALRGIAKLGTKLARHGLQELSILDVKKKVNEFRSGHGAV